MISNLDEILLTELFAVLLICLYEQNCKKLPENAYFRRSWGVFDKADPMKSNFRKNYQVSLYGLMLVRL